MHRTIRFRIAALAVVLTGMLLIVVSVLMVGVLRWQLTDNLDEGLGQRADTIAAVIAPALPERLSVDEDLLVQVVGADGRVVASSANLSGAGPIIDLRPGFRTTDVVPGRPEEFRVLVRPIVAEGEAVLLVVGVNNDDVNDPVTILIRLLALAVPVVVVVLGALTWWLTGRTLRPVESMRIEMAEITGANLGRRLAEPRTGDEIDRLAQTMNATIDRLEGAIRRQRGFVADASHELRSPLTRIRSELEVDLAAGDAGDPVTTERSVLDETISLQHLVEDLLFLARSDDGASVMESRPVDVDDIVLREARRVRERGRVEVDLSQVSAAQTIGDAQQLSRALRNLLDNAERHASTTVVITLAERAGRVELCVADDGAGIPRDERASIFERFSRLDEARTRDAGGAGLGLAIARDIVHRHGGTLGLTEGQATCFVIDLPIAP